MDEQDATSGQAEAFRAARKAARMTQEHLATAAGVSARTVRRAESGLAVTDEVARALCSVLGLDAGKLANQTDHARSTGRREMPIFELGARLFSYILYRWVGGIHPLTMLFMLAPLLDLRISTLVYAGVALAMMFVFAIKCGCTPRQAVAFMRGKVFADGTPVELMERRDELVRGMRERRAASAS